LNISRVIEKIKFNIMTVQVFRLMGRLELIKKKTVISYVGETQKPSRMDNPNTQATNVTRQNEDKHNKNKIKYRKLNS